MLHFDANKDYYYSAVESTFRSSVTTKTQPRPYYMCQSISFCKQEAQLLPVERPSMCNVNPNLNPKHHPNSNDPNSTTRNPNVNQLMHPH